MHLNVKDIDKDTGDICNHYNYIIVVMCYLKVYVFFLIVSIEC